MNRYDIYWARLDPVEGSELSKTRPCVIVSLNALNANLPTVVVCPITSSLRPSWRTRMEIKIAGKRSDICADQIRTLSKARLSQKMGSLTASEGLALRELLTDMYGE